MQKAEWEGAQHAHFFKGHSEAVERRAFDPQGNHPTTQTPRTEKKLGEKGAVARSEAVDQQAGASEKADEGWLQVDDLLGVDGLAVEGVRAGEVGFKRREGSCADLEGGKTLVQTILPHSTPGASVGASSSHTSGGEGGGIRAIDDNQAGATDPSIKPDPPPAVSTPAAGGESGPLSESGLLRESGPLSAVHLPP